MRGFFIGLGILLAIAAAVWVVRPAGVGDPGGLIAMADKTFPAAALYRAQNYPYAGQPMASADKGKIAEAKPADKAPKPGKPPVVVVLQAVEQKAVPITFNGIGTVQAIASVNIKPRLDSQVVEVPVAEGASVKQGDLLFQLDDKSLRSQLAQADAMIAKDTALLEQNKHDLARAEDLLKQKFIAPQVLETAQTTLNQTTAQIGVDNGAKNNLVTQLGYMQLRAPVSGRIGSIAAKSGATVKSGDTLASVNQIDPIYIAFAMPQDRISDIRAAMAAGTAKVQLLNDPNAPTGSIAFMENAVDSTTGTVQVKALMPNPAEKLWPGAFANVVLTTGVEDRAIVVSSAAVQIGQKGTYVFLAKDNHVVLTPVTVARVAGELSIVTSGLAAGDQVVTSGQMALTDGAEISVAKPAEAKGDKKAGDGKVASQG